MKAPPNGRPDEALDDLDDFAAPAVVTPNRSGDRARLRAVAAARREHSPPPRAADAPPTETTEGGIFAAEAPTPIAPSVDAEDELLTRRLRDRTPLRVRLATGVRHLTEAGRRETLRDLAIQEAIERKRCQADALATVIAVIAGKGGVGKTHEVRKAAQTLASYPNTSVAVLEANMDESTLAGTLGRPNPHSLTDILADAAAIRRAGLARLLSYATVEHRVAYFLAPEDQGPSSQIGQRELTTILDLIAERFDVVLIDTSIGRHDPCVVWATQVADHLIRVGAPDRTVMRRLIRSTRYLTGDIRAGVYAEDYADHLAAIRAAWDTPERAERGLPTEPPGARDPRDVTVVYNQTRGGANPVPLARVRELLPGINAVISDPYSETTRAMLHDGTLRLDAMPRTARLATKDLLAAVLTRAVARIEGESRP